MASEVDILIIGAGQSGLGMAVQLVRKYGTRSFEIVEKSDNIGGTWWVNSYPGCGCDVPSHFYSFSFALNPCWSQKFAMQTEIAAYFCSVADKYGITNHVSFHSTVTTATWDAISATWLVTVVDNKSKEQKHRRCKVLVSAVGALSTPRDCDIPGASNYDGKMFHSATWDHSYSIKNKSVVLLGNGCSTTQFIPIISEDAKRVTQFSRQPHWLLERPNPKYSTVFKAVMKWVPGAMRVYRVKIYVDLELEFGMFDVESGSKARTKLTNISKAYIRKEAPAKYQEALIPSTEIGCKRRVMDTGYLSCLHQGNVELIYNDPVDEILGKSVRTRSGREIKADAIILANGFKTNEPLAGIDIVGEKGVSIHDHWKSTSQGVAQAYYGTSKHCHRSPFSDIYVGVPDKFHPSYDWSYYQESKNLLVSAPQVVQHAVNCSFSNTGGNKARQ